MANERSELLTVGMGGGGEEGAASAAGDAAWKAVVLHEDEQQRLHRIAAVLRDMWFEARANPEKAVAIDSYLSCMTASVGFLPQHPPVADIGHALAAHDAHNALGTGHYPGGSGCPADVSTLEPPAATAGVAPVAGWPGSSDSYGGGVSRGASAPAAGASNSHRARGGSAGQEGDDDADDVDMGASSSGGSGVDEPRVLLTLTPQSPPNASPVPTPVAHVRLAPRTSQAVCSACNRQPANNKPMFRRYKSKLPVCEACRCSFRYYVSKLGIMSPDHKKLRTPDMAAIKHLYSVMDAGSVRKGGCGGGHGRGSTKGPRAATKGVAMGSTSWLHGPSKSMVMGGTPTGGQAPPAVRIAIELQPRPETDGLTPVMLPSRDVSGGRARMVDAGAYNVSVVPSAAASQPGATWAVACFVTVVVAGSSTRQGSCPRWLALCNPSQVPGDNELERRLNTPESVTVREYALPFQASTSAAAGKRATFSRLVLQPGTPYKIAVLCAPYAKCKNAEALGCPQLQRYWVQRSIVARERPAPQRTAPGRAQPLASFPTATATSAAASAASLPVSSDEHAAAAAMTTLGRRFN